MFNSAPDMLVAIVLPSLTKGAMPCSATGVDIAEGSLTIGVSYHGFPIYTETKDLCQQTECPVQKGPVTVSLEEPFPVITPPVCLPGSKAHYSYQTLLVQVTNSAVYMQCRGPTVCGSQRWGRGTDAAQLFCLDVAFDVVAQMLSVQSQ